MLPPSESGRVRVEQSPTPEQEADKFSNADEGREDKRNKHALEVLDRNLGWIGKCTGSTNPSLNIAAVIAAALCLCLLLAFIGAAVSGIDKMSAVIERLVAAILAVAGFVFGVTQGSGNKN